LETVLIAFGQSPTSTELDEMIAAVDIDGILTIPSHSTKLHINALT
jgi:hypothetical protein